MNFEFKPGEQTQSPLFSLQKMAAAESSEQSVETETSKRVTECGKNLLACTQKVARNQFFIACYAITAAAAGNLTKIMMYDPDKKGLIWPGLICTGALLAGFVRATFKEINLEKAKSEAEDQWAEIGRFKQIEFNKILLRKYENKSKNNNGSLLLYGSAAYIALVTTWFINYYIPDHKGFTPVGLTCTSLLASGFIYGLHKGSKLRKERIRLNQSIKVAEAELNQCVEASLGRLEDKLRLKDANSPTMGL